MPKNLNTKGLSLSEIIIMVAVIAIVSAAALNSYFGSTRSFTFLSEYKKIMSVIKSARNYAVLSKTMPDGSLPENYGVYIGDLNPDDAFYDLLVFADTGTNPYIFDGASNSESAAGYVPDAVVGSLTQQIPADYSFRVGTLGVQYTLPLTLFYRTGSGGLLMAAKSGAENVYLEKSAISFIMLNMQKGDLEKSIVIFYVSGLPEEYNR